MLGIADVLDTRNLRKTPETIFPSARHRMRIRTVRRELSSDGGEPTSGHIRVAWTSLLAACSSACLFLPRTFPASPPFLDDLTADRAPTDSRKIDHGLGSTPHREVHELPPDDAVDTAEAGGPRGSPIRCSAVRSLIAGSALLPSLSGSCARRRVLPYPPLRLHWRSPRLSLAAASAPSPPKEMKGDLAATKIDPIFAEYGDNGPGCAVGVYRAGQVLFAKGYGYANLEHDIARLASSDGVRVRVGLKAIHRDRGASARGRRGKLSLDDDVRTYIPELPVLPHLVTLRHLLHHTGGLRDYDDLLNLSGYDLADVATEADALHLLALQRGVNFEAGAEWSYSNTGYFLLGQVVGRVSGKSLAEFSKERIFAPLGT